MLNQKETKYIQSQWRQHLDTAPFHYCDQLCEECRFTYCCHVYFDEKKRRLKLLRRGGDPNDPKIILKQLKENFRQTEKLLKKTANCPSDADKILFFRKRLSIYRDAEKWAKIISQILDIAFKKFEENNLPHQLIPYFFKLDHYIFLVPSKIYRAMDYYASDNSPKEEGDYADAVKSACLALYAIRTCLNFLRFIAERNVTDLIFLCAEAMAAGQKLEDKIQNKFPDVESYRSKIVFNSL